MASAVSSGRRRRPREIVLPMGRRIIVALPEDAPALRQKYGSGDTTPNRTTRETTTKTTTTTTTTTTDTPASDHKPATTTTTRVTTSVPSGGDGADDDEAAADEKRVRLDMEVEVVVHGSDEHRAYLTEAQSHHARRHHALRERYGDVVDEWASIQAELHIITGQISRLARQHGEALRENFSRFGYSAAIRTYGTEGSGDEGDDDDDDSGGGGRGLAGSSSGLRSPASSSTPPSSESGRGGAEERRGGQTLQLFVKPVVKQYFHRGLLWRASSETHVMSVELFFDLLYAGILEINGNQLADEATGLALLRFVVNFLMSWTIWAQVVHILNCFETNDLIHRGLVLFSIALMLGFTANMTSAFSATDTYNLLVAYYVAERIKMAIYLSIVAVLLPLVRGALVASVIGILMPAALWLGSTHFAGIAMRMGFIAPALLLESGAMLMLTVVMFRWAGRGAERQDRWRHVRARLNIWFDFYPAINIEHRVERVNAFVSIVLGYSVVGLMFERSRPRAMDAFLGKAVLGLIQAYIFNWLYFDVDGANLHVHAIRRKVYTSMLWNYSHISFVLSYVLAGAALSRLVLTTDCASTDPQDLMKSYRARSSAEIPNAIRFFYSQGLAVALLSTGLIAISHEHKRVDTLRAPKLVRLGMRAVVCVVLLLLPLARSLGSVQLVSLSTGLLVTVLVGELWGRSCRLDPFWGRRDGARIQYSTRCSRRALKAATGADGEVDVDGLGKSLAHDAVVH